MKLYAPGWELDIDTLPPDFRYTIDLADCDSGSNPMNALLTDPAEIYTSNCGNCSHPAEDWPKSNFGSRPCAIYQADIYCADCQAFSYTDEGIAVWTLTGEPI